MTGECLAALQASVSRTGRNSYMQRRGKRACITIEEMLGNGVFCWGRPTLYNEDLRQLESELRESLEMPVEDDDKKGIRLWKE
jgi:hypothetical protein